MSDVLSVTGGKASQRRCGSPAEHGEGIGMGSAPLKIIGSYVSPYVRKVLACLLLKGLDFEIDPITPFFANDEFTKLSPLRRIPVLIHGDLALCDSSVICTYLEETFPEPSLLPQSPRDRARARWLEEFADTRLGDVFIWGLFYQKIVHQVVWGVPGDQERIKHTLNREIPQALGYLEAQLPAEGYLFDRLGVADISIASFFRNAAYAGFSVDEARWPRTANFVARVMCHQVFEELRRFESVQLGASQSGRRQALMGAGARLVEPSFGTREPRRGIMSL